MAKNLASVKPVKCYGWVYNGKISVEEVRDRQNPLHETPCTLLTTARYKKLMDVVKAAQNTYGPTPEMYAALKAAEKAGAL